jgi:hypothetical protein
MMASTLSHLQLCIEYFYKEYKHASLLCIQIIYPHIFLILLTYIHDILNNMHDHKPMCNYHRYISQFTYIFTLKSFNS